MKKIILIKVVTMFIKYPILITIHCSIQLSNTWAVNRQGAGNSSVRSIIAGGQRPRLYFRCKNIICSSSFFRSDLNFVRMFKMCPSHFNCSSIFNSNAFSFNGFLSCIFKFSSSLSVLGDLNDYNSDVYLHIINNFYHFLNEINNVWTYT